MSEKKNKNKRNVRTALILLLCLLILLLCLHQCKRCSGDANAPSAPPANMEQSVSSVPADTLSPLPSSDTVASDTPMAVTWQPRHPLRHRHRGRGKTFISETDGELPISDAPLENGRDVPKKYWNQPLPEEENSSPQKVSPQKATPQKVMPQGKKHHEFRLGVRAGVNYSRIGSLGGIVESGNTRPQYALSSKGGIAPRLGIYGSWQYGRVGLEAAVDYTRLRSQLTETKLVTGVVENTRFNYDILSPGFYAKIYVMRGFYMGAGASANIPFTPHAIAYSTNRPSFYSEADALTELHLKDALKARVQISPGVRIGYENKATGLEVQAGYNYGANDLIHTAVNPYHYNEVKNPSHSVFLSVGWNFKIN